MWTAFLCFLPAVGLGFWQMLMRSPLPAPVDDPNTYYASVTAHGSIMAYVFPTFFAMGFGYAIAVSALGRPLRGEKWAWVGYALSLIGTVMALVPVAAGRASVLYTFYPPLLGSPWYYLGLALVIIGSYFWIALMLVNFRAWKRENPGKPVPLAMFAITACALLGGGKELGVAPAFGLSRVSTVFPGISVIPKLNDPPNVFCRVFSLTILNQTKATGNGGM